MLQRDGEVMMVLVMMMMMIPMKPSSMTVTMAMNFPPSGRNFLGRFLPVGELFLSLCFPPRRGGGILL
jgi:hypothetical protein